MYPPPPKPIAVSEPELHLPCPRFVRFRTGTRVTRFLLFNALIAGLLWGQWHITTELSQLRHLMESGRVIQGVITNRREITGKSTSYHLDYRYHVDGLYDSVEDSERVPFVEYAATQIGAPILITYAPDAPEMHRVGVVNQLRIDDTRDDDYLILLSCGLLGVIAVSMTEWYFQGRLRLLRDGVAIPGEVVDHKLIRGKTTSYKLVYRYIAPFDDLVYREIYVSKQVYDRFADGDTVSVVYPENRPRAGILYTAITEAEIYEPDPL